LRKNQKKERNSMRFLVKSTTPIAEANAAIKDGSLVERMQSIIDDLKPEAVYFGVENGQRTSYFIVSIDDPCDLPVITEPFWIAFNCNVEVQPVMTPEDLAKAGPHIEHAIRRYG
jgi:hypothetical protein